MSLWKKKILDIGKQKMEKRPPSPGPIIVPQQEIDYPEVPGIYIPIPVDDHLDPYVAGRPVDYSFRNVEDLVQLENGIPREYRVGVPKKARSSNKFISRCLWANYNKLSNLKNLQQLVTTSMDRPELISWLDLSFNQISFISDEILNFKNLMILYLHSNKIQFLYEVGKLKQLQRLKTLTLHGNPIEEIPGYRNYIIHLLPCIQNLDFSLISFRERGPEKKKKSFR